jgi:hypothetical protein
VAPKINRKTKSNFFIVLVLMVRLVNRFIPCLIEWENKYRVFLTKFRLAADVYPERSASSGGSHDYFPPVPSKLFRGEGPGEAEKRRFNNLIN